MRPTELIVRPAVRWISLAALGVVAAAAGWLTRATPLAAPAVRVAIRVACDRPAACALAEARALDVWSEDRGPGVPLDLVVAGDALPALAAAGVTWDVLVPDIDAVAAAEAARLRDRARPADWFAEYHDYRETTAHLEALVALAPARAQLHAIGVSLEGRPLWALQIGHGAQPMLITGTLHAREWLATAVTTCVADRLVRDYDRDPAIRALVDRSELWIVPIDNPDGYQYTWSTDRYWRKNRRDRHGVDLNRNFSVGFGGTGSSDSERSEIYRGPYAFSEPESAALRDLARRHAFTRYIDFHAYGQLVLYPWSHTGTPPPDRDRLAAVGDRMTSALVAAHKTRYKLSSAIEFYPSSGTTMDWLYGELGALAYAIELRPTWPRGAGGFVQPPAQIRPTCDEGLAAVLALGAAP